MNKEDFAVGAMMILATVTMGTAASVFGYLAFSGFTLYGNLPLVLFFVWLAITAFMLALDITLFYRCYTRIQDQRRLANLDVANDPESNPLVPRSSSKR